jgi:hypothetical protein
MVDLSRRPAVLVNLEEQVEQRTHWHRSERGKGHTPLRHVP